MHPDTTMHSSEDSSSVVQPPLDAQCQGAFSPLDGVEIQDPIELAYLLDYVPETGFHQWQIQFMLDFALSLHTKDFPFQAEVRACNGSGKDKFIVALCVVWLAMAYKCSRSIVTNGSGVQLDNQTEAYIEQLCNKANAKFGGAVFRCNYRYYECLLTQSPITLFATDEPNKAEGFHPLIPGGKMAIFASEAKAIPDEIFTALTRCTGYTHRVDVSTPGLPLGTFYDRCSTSLKRPALKDIKSIEPTDTIEYHVTAFDCPHITKNEIENFAKDLAGGINSPVYKSGILAEFGTTDEMVVVPYTYIWQAITPSSQPKWIPATYNKAGLDLSDGGDETVLTIRNGNKHIKTIPFKLDNTQDTIAFLDEKFREYDLNHPDSLIHADCGGLGKPMLDQLRRMGWTNIRYVDNRAKPYYPKTYLNRGSEVWFHTRLLLERRELIVMNDKMLIKQMASRYYKIDVRGRHQLLSKIESRSRGYPSPDRADSFVLCFWDYKSTNSPSPLESLPKSEQEKKRPFSVAVPTKPVSTFTMQSHARTNEKSLASFKRTFRKQKDFTLLQEEVNNYNKLRRMSEVTVEQPTDQTT